MRWRYWSVNEHGKRKQVYIWCTGSAVVAVADGTKTTKQSARCKSPLPWGAVQIKWPADAEFNVNEADTLVWTVLKPADWCKERHLARLALCRE